MTHLRQWRSAGRALERTSRPLAAGGTGRSRRTRERDEQRRDGCGRRGPPTESRNRRQRRLSWAWFAGADARVLALVPSERSFLEAQGLVIVAMACVTGFAVAVAGSGWWNVPITHILWLGLVWTAVICIVDRLIYKSFGTSRRANLVLAVPRAVLSLMLALVLGLPMVQFIFKPSISNQLTLTSAAAQKDARRAALVFYEPKIAQATTQIAAIQDHETTLENRDQQVHAPVGLRGQRAVVLAHTPHRLRALVPVLRATGDHRARDTRARPARRPREDRRAQGEDRRLADE